MRNLDFDVHPSGEEIAAANSQLNQAVDGILRQTANRSLSEIIEQGRVLNIRMGVEFSPRDPNDEALYRFIGEQLPEDPNVDPVFDGIEVVYESSKPPVHSYEPKVNLSVTHRPKGIRVLHERSGVTLLNEAGQRILPLSVFDISDLSFRKTSIQLRPDNMSYSAGLNPFHPDHSGQFDIVILPAVTRLISRPGPKLVKII